MTASSNFRSASVIVFIQDWIRRFDSLKREMSKGEENARAGSEEDNAIVPKQASHRSERE
jgi:hypothetical protein